MLIAKRVPLLVAIISLAACNDGAQGPTESAEVPLTIAIVSGNGQTGKAGEPLAEAFAVRVTDASGRGVAAAPVQWSVTSGGGRTVAHPFDYPPSGMGSVLVTLTDTEGRAEAYFWPLYVRDVEVRATVETPASEPAIFTASATVLILSNLFWGVFLSPTDSPDATLPIGGEVEWRNEHDVTVEVVSTSAPPGGASFHALLKGGEILQFRPDTTGTWSWAYYYLNDAGERTAGSVGKGMLTVDPAP